MLEFIDKSKNKMYLESKIFRYDRFNTNPKKSMYFHCMKEKY